MSNIPNIQQNDIAEILRDVISSMVLTVNVNNPVDNNDGTFTFETCNTYYLADCMVFSINDDKYEVVSFVLNESITYKPKGAAPEIMDSFVLSNPMYLVGTPRMAQKPLEQLKSNLNRFPFIWLLEPFAGTVKGETIALTKVNTTATLFFFNAANKEHWLNIDHREQIVLPMKGLVNAFLQACAKSKAFGDIEDDWTYIDRIEYGKGSVNKGYTSQILPETLSGVEIRVKFPILGTKRCTLNNNCN